MQNKYVQIEGVATYLHHTGATTLPELPPPTDLGEVVLCLHGAGGNGALFAPLMRELEASHSVIAFDQPGHGRSGSLDSLGAIDRMADFTLALCDKLGLSRPVLLGHAMGAGVALQVALERPGFASGLIICSAGDGFDVPQPTLEQAGRIRDGKERRAFDPTAFSKQASPEVMKQGFMEGMKTDPRAAYGDLVACMEWDAADRLSQIETPALIVHGDDDRGWIKGRAKRLSELLPDAHYGTIPGAGHTLPLEAPRSLGEVVGRYLEGASA